jgi:hypothetical protein
VNGTFPRAAELAARGARGEEEAKKRDDLKDFVLKYLGWQLANLGRLRERERRRRKREEERV